MPGLITAKRLREERAVLSSRMNEILEAPAGEGGDLSAEQRTEFDRLHTRQEDMRQDIERIEYHEQTQAELAASQAPVAGGQRDAASPDVEARDAKINGAFDAYLRHGMTGLNAEQRTIMSERFTTPEQRAQGTNVDTAGGYLVPEGFFGEIVEARQFFGGMRQSRATVIPTASGNPIPIPTDDDTSNTGALVGENQEHTETALAFGAVTLNAYTYSSKLVKVSRQLLNDSAFPLQPFIARKFGQRLGRIQNTHFTTGDNSAKPQGAATGAATGATGASGQTTSVTWNDLLTLEHAVDRDYRMGAEYMFHDSTLLALKKLKDGEGRPLWQSGVAIGAPDTINGYRYVVNNDVAEMVASAKSILFGDFSLYYIRDVNEILVLRLDERYAEYLQVGFLAFARCDGRIVDAGTNPIKAYVNAAS